MTSSLPIARLALLPGTDRPDVMSVVDELSDVLRRTSGVHLSGVFSPSDPIPEDLEADLMVVVGGDGSMLRGCRRLGAHQRPMVGVNLGRLGFLTDLTPDEFLERFHLFQSGEYEVVEHLMLECRHETASGVSDTDLVLNEVTVTSAGSLKMLDIAFQIDGEDVTTFSCDGLIISTPVGSTAHNLSAGGPILRQDLQAVVITPVCPHTLTVRPIVDSSARIYQLAVKDAPPGVRLVIDGQIQRPVASTDSITIRKAVPTFKLVRLPGHSYYGTLHRKLGWKGQIEYRERRGH